MRLSIITINYNNKAGLERTIHSVKEQSFHDYEWMIIDGGSDDGSRDLIERNMHLFGYWCSEKDKGVYNAQNKGILKAKGEYLCFMNSGDTFESKETLQKMFQNVVDEDVIYGDWTLVYSDRIQHVSSPKQWSLGFICRYNVCCQAMLIKRSCFETGLFDESFTLFADWKKWIDLTLLGKKFKYVPINVCLYDGYGVSSKSSPQKERERTRLIGDYNTELSTALMAVCRYSAELEEYTQQPLVVDTKRFVTANPFYCKLIHANLIIIKILKRLIRL